MKLPATLHSYKRRDIFCHWYNLCLAVVMGNNTEDSFIGSMAEILRVGLAVYDATKQSRQERRRTRRLHIEDRDWMLETTFTPQRAITITLME